MAIPGASICRRNKATTKTDAFTSSTSSSAHRAREATETLIRHLARARIESGEALETARRKYRSRHRRSQASAAIPEAWRELAEKGNEDLVELLAGAVELKTGARPDNNDVAEFFAALGKPVID